MNTLCATFSLLFQSVNSTLFGYNYGITWISDVSCVGNESSLLDCSFTNASCNHRTTNYAVAACSMTPINESEFLSRAESGNRVLLLFQVVSRYSHVTTAKDIEGKKSWRWSRNCDGLYLFPQRVGYECKLQGCL